MSKKLMVIDDEIGLCNVVRRYFSEKGYTVFISQEGGEAISILKTEKPNILILDIKMPGINGVEILKLAKQLNKTLKVIVVSAIRDDSIVKEVMRLGASSYITKPFKLEELEKKVTGKE